MPERFTVIDLFAGAGGLSTGAGEAFEDLHLVPSEHVELHAINHWEPAIRTHEINHPWAEHYHAKIEELHPPNVVEPGELDLLLGGPECTHFSNARGGKPVSEQKRASAWHVLDWIEKLRPEHVLLENVPEFRKWGPIVDGEPTRDGSIFERWIGMLEALGYSVVYDDAAEDHGVVLDAADYGEAQSRERLFIMASRSKRPTAPEPTHVDEDPSKPNRRTAAEIIDWSDLGTSIWTRDLEHPRVQPLAENTMGRIAEGIRRHCDDRLAPLADVLETIGPDELEALRNQVVPVEHAETVAAAVDKPFLVQLPGAEASSTPYLLGQHSNSVACDVTERPTSTVAKGGKLQLASPEAFCLRQQSGGVPVPMDDPLPTISKDGAIGLATLQQQPLVQPKNGRYGDDAIAYDPTDRPHHTVIANDTRQGHVLTPYLCPLYNGRSGQRPRTRRVDRPAMTVPANKGAPACLATPYLIDYHGNSNPAAVDVPLGTVETKDRYALCVPSEWPWGIDVRYRMLKPYELKQAQGFPSDYEITGSAKKTVTAQIGNAVPVQLARALIRHLLADETPSLSSYGGGIQPDPDADVPAYEEVLGADD